MPIDDCTFPDGKRFPVAEGLRSHKNIEIFGFDDWRWLVAIIDRAVKLTAVNPLKPAENLASWPSRLFSRRNPTDVELDLDPSQGAMAKEASSRHARIGCA